jgi:hypothetical protein
MKPHATKPPILDYATNVAKPAESWISTPLAVMFGILLTLFAVLCLGSI